ncbi:ester cyclase [Mycobacterium deserti]|uniref:ester cyclase n=1 Tax=Mycobacterium deserti TaxID=2978347 RepID=UPI0028D74F7C|nr:nuclear transport factor 2 family protein [Mycobacterium deserti]
MHAFWDQVWNAHDAEAVDRFVVDDFVIVTGGEPLHGRENFKNWVADFLAAVDDLHLEVLESFQNADGSRVTSRWLLTGKNNGYLGTDPDGRVIAMTGTAVWAVRADGKLLSNHVERAAFEQLQRLTAATS